MRVAAILLALTLVSANDTSLLRLQKICTPHWSIHGLWPNWGENCKDAPPFSEDVILPIRPQLERFWPSCQGRPNEWFWEHEWSKHGSCSKMDQLEYFSFTINLLGNYSHLCTTQVKRRQADAAAAGETLDAPNECSLCFNMDYQLIDVSQCKRDKGPKKLV